MGVRRSNRRGWLLWCFCLISGSAFAGDGSGNFERTVGVDLARLSATVRDEPLPDLAPRGLRCDEFCEADARHGKRMDVPAVDERSDRLDRRLRSSYRQMGENLAARLWDDPQGRRIKFDIEGRPGIGLEIPFN